MSGLVRPLLAPGEDLVSLLGNGCGRTGVANGGDLNDEGGGDDIFDFLSGCGGIE
jgi:hypothetical protein